MARLYRPPIPIETKCRVALRQLGEMFIDDVIVANRFVPRDTRHRSLGRLLDEKLVALAELLKCEVSDLRLDHDPALGARPKHRRGLGKKTYYIPDANDPAHLFYRPHGPQFEGSHLIKTNIRGDHGQHPDRVLIKKARRAERGPKPKRGPKMQGRGFEKKTKPKWPKRQFRADLPRAVRRVQQEVDLKYALLIVGAVWLAILRTLIPVAADDKLPDVTLNSATSVMIDPGCIIAMIATDTAQVTVDWPCIERTVAKFDPKKNFGEMTTSMAVILKAVHDGTAKEAGK